MIFHYTKYSLFSLRIEWKPLDLVFVFDPWLQNLCRALYAKKDLTVSRAYDLSHFLLPLLPPLTFFLLLLFLLLDLRHHLKMLS